MKFYLVCVITAWMSLINESSCCRREPEMPPVTSVGANTFGCYVNGELFVPEFGTAGWAQSVLYAMIDTIDLHKKCLIIIAYGHGGRIMILQDTIVKVGQKVQLMNANLTDKKYSQYTSTIESELLLTRLDLENSVISGLFSFKAMNESGDVIVVTDGQFDIGKDEVLTGNYCTNLK